MKTQAGDVIVLCKSDMAECAQIAFFRPENGELKQLAYPGGPEHAEYLSCWAQGDSESRALFRDVARLVAQAQGLMIREPKDRQVYKQLETLLGEYISCREFYVPS